MRTLVCSFLLLTFGSVSLGAQDYPRWEAFLGYSHQQADVTGAALGLNGGHFSASENVNSWFGGMLDVSGQLAEENGNLVHMETIAYGPRFTWRKLQSFVPSAHVALGITHSSAGLLGFSRSKTEFAVVTGGAIDIPLNGRVAFRVVQADWIGTRFHAPSIRNNIRLSSGIQFRFYGDRFPF